MIAKALRLPILILILSSALYSQTPAEVRIDPNQPTVYFTPEGLDGDKLWLRLHNNSRWAISFRTAWAARITIPYRLADGPVINAMIEGTEVEPEYLIENPIIGGYASYWCASVESWLAPGTSALMSVEVERLKPIADYSVKFRYEWAGKTDEPEHRVKFRYRPEIKLPGGN